MQSTLVVNKVKCKTIVIDNKWYVIIDEKPCKLYYGWRKDKKCIGGKARILKLKSICNCCGMEFFGELAQPRKFCGHSCNGKLSHCRYIKILGDKELKQKAWSFINHAITAGKIIRPKICSCCGKNCGVIEFHHPNYNKLNEGMWLCKSCHEKLGFGHEIKGELVVYNI